MDQEKEPNPIGEIFDELFTLMEDLETRSAALLEYMKEQGGVTDGKLAPYLDRAAAASDVRWRAARARMEHLLAPKPKSATEVGKDEKGKGESQSQRQAKGKEVDGGGTKPQVDEEKAPNADSKDLGKELASAQPPESKGDRSQDAKPAAAESKAKDKDQDDNKGEEKQAKGTALSPSDTEAQASARSGGKNPESQRDESQKNQGSQSDGGKSAIQPAGEEKPQTQKAAK